MLQACSLDYPTYEGDISYANSRLNNTLVYAHDEVCLVIGCAHSEGEFYLKRLRDNKEYYVEMSAVSTKPIRLGYEKIPTGKKGVAGYYLRTPARHWKQGLNSENIVVSYSANEFGYLGIPLCSDKMLDIIEGNCLALWQSVPLLQLGEFQSVGFSRDFCGSADSTLLYKGQSIGQWGDYSSAEDKIKVKIPKDLCFLSGELTSQINCEVDYG